MNDMPVKSSRRAGGREARKALRAAPLAEESRPIRPGMEGGRYKPLSDTDINRIHEAALTVLEEIGLSQAPETGVEYMRAYGAVHGHDGRMRFPRKVVMKALDDANRSLTLHGRDPQYDIHPGGYRVHYGTAGAAVHIADLATNSYVDTTTRHLHDAARLAQALDNVHFFQRCMVCRDITDNREMDLNTLYAAVTGTTKHVGSSFFVPEHVDDALELLHIVAGDEATWRARPFVSASNCFVVPPLKFATESCECLEKTVAGGMPILLLSAGQAGATAPAALAGAVTQAVAECLAGLVYVNAVKPGAPAIFGTWPFVSDLRTGAMSGGSGEQALLTAACGQMGRFYDLPSGSAAGMADAKFPDAQSGYEKGVTLSMAGLSGLNMVYESLGMQASLLGFSPEGMIIDNDLIGQCLRCVRGIEVDDDTLSIETMRNVCLEGPGHYLGHEQTLSRMQTDYVYPEIGDRFSPKEWQERGKPVLIESAIRRKAEILDGPNPAAFSPEVDAAIRERFTIHMD